MRSCPCFSKEEGLKRGTWTELEDKLLTAYIKTHGEGKWRDLPKKAGLKRCGKSCRLRWRNYLKPGIKRGNISEDEEDLIIRLHNLLGNRWSLIAGRLPGRTDNEIKNYWNSTLRKRSAKAQPSTPPPQPKLTAEQPPVIMEPDTKIPPIKTKATRCTTKIMAPTQDSTGFNNLSSTLHRHPFETNEVIGDDDHRDLLNYFGIKDETQASNVECMENINEVHNNLSLDLEPFDVSMFDYWTLNAAMDLGSSAFLIDPEKWA